MEPVGRAQATCSSMGKWVTPVSPATCRMTGSMAAARAPVASGRRLSRPTPRYGLAPVHESPAKVTALSALGRQRTGRSDRRDYPAPSGMNDGLLSEGYAHGGIARAQSLVNGVGIIGHEYALPCVESLLVDFRAIDP